MKNFDFNEKQDIENIIANGYVDEENYRTTIGQLAIYNLKVLGMDKESNYDAIKEYMSVNASDFFEAEYQQVIYKEIACAKKRILRDIEFVSITSEELRKISELDDIKKEKIAFVLVATAKYYDAIKHSDEHYTNISSTETCKIARVTIKSSERNDFMSFIYNDGVAARHNSPNSNGKKILFISCNRDEDIAMRLSQIDFQELAYQYLNWKNNGGFDKCQRCGRLIKHKPNIKYCEECSTILTKENWKKASDKYYNSHKNPTSQND